MEQEEKKHKNISTKEYNIRTVYECFDDSFTDDFGIPALNLPQITIDNIPCSHKRALYTPDLLPVSIYVTS